MKILVLILSLCLALSGSAFAADATETLYSVEGVLYTNSYTLMSAVTTTGTVSDSKHFKKYRSPEPPVPLSHHTFTAVWSGTTPSNLVWEIQCSENGTDFPTGSDACALVTQTTATVLIHIDKPGIRHVRSKLVSRSNGTGDTAITITGTSGGQ